jgi:hypothetical protein
VAYGDVNQQIDLISQPDIADFEIGAATTLTREHLLAGIARKGASAGLLVKPKN